MDIQVEKLRQALALVAAAIPRGKASPAITTSVLFGEGKVTATNLEYWVSVDLPELGDASFVLPHKALTEALKFTPGRATLTLTADEIRVVLTTPDSRLSLIKSGQPHDFPLMPHPPGEPFTVDGDKLVHGLLEIQLYASTEKARPVLTGVLLKLGHELDLAAADGFRLAVHQTGMELNGGETGHVAIVPGEAVKVLGNLWRRGDKPPDIDAAQIAGETATSASVQIGRLAVAKRKIRLVEDGGNISFTFGGITMCSHLIQGKFPRYDQLIPETEGGRKITVDAEELLRAVNQVAEVASSGSNICRLRWADDKLTVSSRSSEVGEAEVSIPAIAEGDGAEIAFNLRNLQRYLRGKDHVVTLATVPGEPDHIKTQPGVFTHRGTPMVVIMPMFVPATTEQPPVSQESPPGKGDIQSEGPAGPSATETQPTPRRRRRRSAAH